MINIATYNIHCEQDSFCHIIKGEATSPNNPYFNTELPSMNLKERNNELYISKKP